MVIMIRKIRVLGRRRRPRLCLSFVLVCDDFSKGVEGGCWQVGVVPLGYVVRSTSLSEMKIGGLLEVYAVLHYVERSERSEKTRE
jgi:hypothetical protein